MTWLVTGAGGTLGCDLVDTLSRGGARVAALPHARLDIADPPALRAVFDAHRPQVVVNCAAYTAVDDAESDEAEALRVNGEGPRRLAELCRERGVRLVHVSTDYVFSGHARTPYGEDAEPDPRTAYGRTKLAGEHAVLDVVPERSAVVRTAWLYGRRGRGFVRTMLEMAAKDVTLDVVCDQHGQPTWSADLAERIVALGGDPTATGVFHAACSGETSRFELAREIFRLVDADPTRVRPASSEDQRRAAERPAYSALAQGRWKELGMEPMRDWRTALRDAIPVLRRGEPR